MRHEVFGFSLIGLLLYTAISLILTMGLISHTIQMQKFCLRFWQQLKIQNDLLLLKFYLNRDLHNANFRGIITIGHASSSPLICPVNIATHMQQVPSTIIRQIAQKELLLHSDILLISNVVHTLRLLLHDLPLYPDDAMIHAPILTHAGDKLMLCDYSNCDAVMVRRDMPQQQAKLDLRGIRLSKIYRAGSLIFETRDVIYYLRQSVLSSTSQPLYALYRDDLQRNAVAISENIMAFNLEYSAAMKELILHITMLDQLPRTLRFSACNTTPAISS